MTNQTEVVNDALDWLGEAPSTGEDDTSLWVVRLNNMFSRERRKLFEEHDWNFASEVKLLAAVGDAPIDFTYGFGKPAQCRRIIKVTAHAAPSSNQIRYQDRGGRILTDSETTYLKYIDGTVEDTLGRWPEVVAGALAVRMAWRAGAANGKPQSAIDDLARNERRLVGKAKLWDAQQMNGTPIPPGRYETARGGFRHRYADD